MRPLALRLGVSLLIVSVLLLLTWSLLLSAVPVRSSSSSGNVLAQSGIITDTRWLELIRSTPAQPRSPVALPTINLQLSDSLIAGRTASAALIAVNVKRGETVTAYGSATPYFDGQGYFYIVPLYYYYPGAGGGGYTPLLVAGDVVWLTQGSTNISLTVPNLLALVNTQNDVVYGTAPISDTSSCVRPQPGELSLSRV